jgi:hypothetical protein
MFRQLKSARYTRRQVKHTVRQRVKLGSLGFASIDTRETGQGVNSVDVHGARSANSFSAGSSESKGRVKVVLDLDLQIEYCHSAALVEWSLIGIKGNSREHPRPWVHIERDPACKTGG